MEPGRLDPESMRRIVRAMTDTMVHRGPDDEGIWVSRDGRCALGHRRLSIIDTSSGGHQPMSSEDDSRGLSFNGEIFNFLELRQTLEARGHRFRSRSDTEVLFGMLGDEGEAAVPLLDGQFAFAHYEAAHRSLLLARDPFGEKPLCWAKGDGWFAFASELHALTVVPGFDATIEPERIAEYLALQYVDAPRTIYRGAHKLPPGHLLRYSADGRVTIREHFRFEPRGGRRERPLDDLADELEALLLRSTELRMISDVPLGAFLSGGVDSSTVVALMAKVFGQSVKTFTIGFENTVEETEHLFARQTAEYLRTEHHERVLAPNVVELIQHLSGVLDEPNGDSSCLPTWLVSKVAKEQVTVALSGDGGDELFGGYGRYFVTLDEEARARRAKGGSSWRAGSAYYSARMMIFEEPHLSELFGSVPRDTTSMLAALRAEVDGDAVPLLHRMRRADQRHYLPGAVLPKVDRMSMQHSLEVRTPFLSRDVARFAESLDTGDLYTPGMGKVILKRVAERYLPREWIDRPKRGFGVPIGTGWARESMLGMLRELVLSSDGRLLQWLDRKGLEAFCRRQSGEHTFSFYQVWVTLLLELWLRAHPAVPQRYDAPSGLGRRDLGAPAAQAAEPATANASTSREPVLEPRDLALLAHVQRVGRPAVWFASARAPSWVAMLPEGSVVVGPEVAGVARPRSVELAWIIDGDHGAIDSSVSSQLPDGTWIFDQHIDWVRPEVRELMLGREVAVVHRGSSGWELVDVPTRPPELDALQRQEVGAGGWKDRLRRLRFSRRIRGFLRGGYRGNGGLCYVAPLPGAVRRLIARRPAAASEFVLLEDGRSLPGSQSPHVDIREHGRGRFSFWEGLVYFSSSDGSDPNVNGRRYEIEFRPLPEDLFPLRRPFSEQGGHARVASLGFQPELDDAIAVVYEDGKPLPLSTPIHDEIRQFGRGRHTVWEGCVWFSSRDGSDPNTNLRDYQLRLLPRPSAEDAEQRRIGGAFADHLSFAAAFRKAIAVERSGWTSNVPMPAVPRVCFVVGSLGAGGTERQIVNMSSLLARRGWPTSIALVAGTEGSAGHYLPLLDGTGVNVVSTAMPHDPIDLHGVIEQVGTGRLELLAGMPDEFRELVWNMVTHLAVLRPDVLHCSLDSTNLTGGIAGWLLGVPRIRMSWRSVNPSYFPHLHAPWFQRWYQILMESPRVAVSANSRFGGEDYARWLGLPADAFALVPNGLDVACLGIAEGAAALALRRQYGVPETAPVLGGLMRLSQEKRPLVFVEVFGRVLAGLPDAHAFLAGAGVLESAVVARIRDLGIGDRLHLLGRRPDAATVHGASDVILLTSEAEGCPNVLLEAQWFGRPVVSTRVGGAPETFREGETGFACEKDDLDGLAAVCVELLADRERCRRIGALGHDFVATNFSLEAMIDRVVATYD